MIQTAIFAAHLVAAAALLCLVVYPWRQQYDFWVVRNQGLTITAAGLFWRYAYATLITWACSGPIAYFLVERLVPGSPARTRVAWSVIAGFLLVFLVALIMGTNILFPGRPGRPAPIRWMDPFLSEFGFIAFIGYGLLMALVSTLTQYLARRG